MASSLGEGGTGGTVRVAIFLYENTKVEEEKSGTQISSCERKPRQRNAVRNTKRYVVLVYGKLHETVILVSQ